MSIAFYIRNGGALARPLRAMDRIGLDGFSALGRLRPQAALRPSLRPLRTSLQGSVGLSRCSSSPPLAMGFGITPCNS